MSEEIAEGYQDTFFVNFRIESREKFLKEFWMNFWKNLKKDFFESTGRNPWDPGKNPE